MRLKIERPRWEGMNKNLRFNSLAPSIEWKVDSILKLMPNYEIDFNETKMSKSSA